VRRWWRLLLWRWHLSGCRRCEVIVDRMLPAFLLCEEGFDLASAARPTPTKEEDRP